MSLPRFLPRADLQSLLDVLEQAGYRTHAPQLRDGAIVLAPVQRVDQLPRGVRDSQAPGRYRLEPAADQRCFAYASGAQALKPLFFAGHEPLWEASQQQNELRFNPVCPPTEKPLAVIGVRACDIAALALHDAHFLGTTHADTHYAARRAGAFLVAVNCTHPAATCFCRSTGDGPEVQRGYDLLLDELEEGFLLRAQGDAAERVVARLHTTPVTPAQVSVAEQQRHDAAVAQTRALPGRDLQQPLFANLEHPRWNEVAARCLSCGNCTAVCPTCFCNSHVDDAALDGSASRHYRVWDSCFTEGHSYIHGIVIRADTRKRYRQWLTHKLGSWHEQYGRSGCVGCGRCITWCPAGIDITEEAAAIAGGKS